MTIRSDGQLKDFEESQFDARYFVRFCFNSAIQKAGFHWWNGLGGQYEETDPDDVLFYVKEYHEALYRMVQQFDQRNQQQLTEMIGAFDEDTLDYYSNFRKVLQAFVGVDGDFSYGRLTALMALSCRLAVLCARDDRRIELDKIHVFTYNYLNGAIHRNWPIASFSWAGFLQWSRHSTSRMDNVLNQLCSWKCLVSIGLIGAASAFTINRLLFS